MIPIIQHALTGEFEFVSSTDDTLNRDDPGFAEKWRLYKDGRGELPVRPGTEPTIFVVRYLTQNHRRILSPELARAHKHDEYTSQALCDVGLFALRAIKNLRGPDGKLINVTLVHDDYGETRCDVSILEVIGRGVAEEIGLIALRRSEPDPLS